MVESVQIAIHVQLQTGRQTLRLWFGLLLDFPVQILQNGHILRLGISDIGTVDCPNSPVNERLFHRGKTFPATGRHLAEGQDEVGLQRQRVIIFGVVQVDIHRIQVECPAASAAGGGKPDHLSAQTLHQGEILRFRVTDQDIVLGDQKHIQDLPLGREGLTAAGGAENQAVGCLVLFSVCQNHIARSGIESIVQSIAALEDLLGGKGHHNRNRRGGKATPDLDLVDTQRKSGYKSLLLLKVQPGKLAVVLLRHACGSGNFIVQLPLCVCQIHNQESHLKHPLVSALQIPKDVLGLACVGGNIRWDDIHIEALPDSPLLGIDLHAVNVGDFPLDGTDRFILIHAVNVDAQKNIAVRVQHFSQNTVIQFRGGDLQEGCRTELYTHLKLSCSEAEGGGSDEVLYMEAGRCQPVPFKRKPFPIRVKDAMQQFQPFPAVQCFGKHAHHLEMVQGIGQNPGESGSGRTDILFLDRQDQ